MTGAFRRVSAASGLIFVIAFAAANFTAPEPGRTASKETIVRYLVDHQAALQVSGALLMVISGLFALFTVGVWTAVRSIERNESRGWLTTGLVGGIVMAINIALLGASIGALGRLATDIASQPILAQALFASGQTLATSIVPFIALFLLGMGVATLESRALPAWTAWLAFLGAALSIVLVLQLVYPGPLLEDVGIVQALAVLGWMAIVGVYMLLPPRRALAQGALQT